MTVRSDLVTLKQIVDEQLFFSVPIYQRLYVWGSDQIKTLLADLWTAFDEGKPFFYLGSALVVEQSSGEAPVHELIDGQQRFTTLWMMSLVWSGALARFRHSATDRPRLRVSFAIRPDVEAFFRGLLLAPDAAPPGPASIVDALAMIRSFPSTEPKVRARLDEFTRFIYENVRLVLTRVPPHTDLNKLFEAINSRGEQLQHHEILKARLLAKISDAVERARYARLWEACAEMGSYVEKGLKAVSGIKLAQYFSADDQVDADRKLSQAGEILKALTELQQGLASDAPVTLSEILTHAALEDGERHETEDEEPVEADDVRSIMSFPVLLEHVLRIWLRRHGRQDLPRIGDKELLDLFDKSFFSMEVVRDDVTSYIELLWEVRFAFDKYVIKWVSVGDDEERHLICKLRRRKTTRNGKQTYSLVREQPTSNEGFALLQSMLYHSQQITTHYWMTPLLAYMQGHPEDHDHFHAYLRHVDNHLLCSTDDRSLSQRSWDFLDDSPASAWHQSTLDCSDLEQPLGLGFRHYWFYKLEYIIWEKRHAEQNDRRWDEFYLTAKNSIEHISPQSPQEIDLNRVSDDVLDTLGNLALVSRSINSEYGNKPFNEKRMHFINRNRDRLDSLKMALIYEHDQWNDQLAAAHQDEMVALVRSYLHDEMKP